jgi:hypothetical protein
VNDYRDEKWCKVQGARHKVWMILLLAVHFGPRADLFTNLMGTVAKVESKQRT